MKKLIIIATLVVSGITIYSCNKEKKDTLTTTAYLDLPAVNYEYFEPNPTSPLVGNADSLNRVATLGRVLFYDTRLSVNNAVSCGSCHKQEHGFADNVALSRGFEGRLTGRNSPGLNGLGSHGTFFWDGRERVLANLIMRPVSNHVEMGIEDLNAVPAKLSELSYYKKLFNDAYHDENITLERISNAVACFVQSIGKAPMTKAIPLGNDLSKLSELQIRGKALFDTVYDCGSCHRGFGGYGGGGMMVDIGLDNTYTDKGLGAISGVKEQMGTFKVPGLTNVAVTAPYMHDGRYKSLDEVLEHYSHGIVNSPNLNELLKDKSGEPLRMNITEGDKKAIIAFLGSLTDYETNTDVKFSNPFKAK